MKHFLLSYSLLLLLLLTNSCNDEESVTNTPEAPELNSIVLTASVTEIEVDGEISFSVKGNDGNNYNNQATFLVDGNILSTNTFTPTEIKNYKAQATYKNLLSNEITINVLQKEVSAISVVSDNDWVTLADYFNFTVFNSNNEQLTTGLKIYVNGNEIEGSSFKPEALGIYQIHATHTSFTSDILEVEVKTSPATFTQKVLIEDFTGTWCGWCPRVSYAIEKVLEETDKAIIAAIHRGNGSDPYHFDESNINTLDEGRYPTAKLNRLTTWEPPEPSYVSQALNLTGDSADLGLAIKSNLNGTVIDLEIRMAFLKAYGELKYVVYLVEDALKFNQTNYTQYYGGQSILTNFKHDNVLRKVVTNLYGDPIPTEHLIANGEFISSIEVPYPELVSDPSNIKFIAFILNSNGKVLNVQSAKINSFRNYN